jgi:hypothetical protein
MITENDLKKIEIYKESDKLNIQSLNFYKVNIGDNTIAHVYVLEQLDGRAIYFYWNNEFIKVDTSDNIKQQIREQISEFCHTKAGTTIREYYCFAIIDTVYDFLTGTEYNKVFKYKMFE